MQIQSQTTPITLIDTIWPHRRVLHNVALVVIFTIFIALSAQVAIPLPFSPVPITLQTLTVLLTGILLGSRLGTVTVLAYLAEGAIGLPVFAFGTFGFTILVGPTGGYLFGFVVAAGLVGFLAEQGWDRQLWTTVLAMVLGNLVIYLFGVGWLSTFLGFAGSVAAGVVPFLIGDVFKIILAVAVLPGAWALLQKR